MSPTFVRVRDGLGNEFSLPETSPFITAGSPGRLDDLTILDDEPGADSHGHALPPYVAPTPVLDDDTGELLRGQALDDALLAAGLPVGGHVADKQARLAAHNTNTDTEV